MDNIKDYLENVGLKVRKRPLSDKNKGSYKVRPFKSEFKTNTINGVIEHPHLKIPAYTFEEDDSYVECRRCETV